jgi:hypothetical protein
MTTARSYRNDPASLEAEIARTRASLGRKLQELERRFSPRARLAEVRARVDPTPYVGWAAVAAVAAGTWMAVSGVRRYRDGHAAMSDEDAAEMLGE